MESSIDSKVVTEVVCTDCGVEVREGSEYCYNCGHAIAKTVSDAPSENNEIDPTKTKENGFQTTGPGAIKKDANVRRRSRRPLKPSTSEPVQVVWERRQDPGIGFLIVSLIAGVVALLLIFIAYYLK
jgi:hypothetical protein